MLAFLLRLIQGNPEAHDLTNTKDGSTVTPWSLRSVLPREEPKPTGTTEALYPASDKVPCAKCRLLVHPVALRREKPHKGWCGACIAEHKAALVKKRTRLAEELRQAEERKDVVRMPERGRG